MDGGVHYGMGDSETLTWIVDEKRNSAVTNRENGRERRERRGKGKREERDEKRKKASFPLQELYI